MRRTIIVCLVCFASLSGCAGQPGVAIDVTHLEGWGTYQPEAFIQVLQAPPATPFVPIARLTVNGVAGMDRAQALAALQQRAKELGANAIVITDQTESAAPSLTFNPSGGTYGMAAPSPPPRIIGEAIHMNAGNP